MKLNSKTPILIIVFTIVIFLGISIKNNSIKPIVENVIGNISDIEDVDIDLIETKSSNYFSYKYSLNKEDIHKEKIKKQFYETYGEISEDISLIDITSGNDLISYIGYETRLSQKDELYLVIDERKNNDKSKMILPRQGEDIEISNNEVDKNEIKRHKIKIEKPKDCKYQTANILSSNRYNNDLYILTQYYRDYGYTTYDTLEVAKLNLEDESIEIIENIKINDEIKRSYFYIVNSHKDKNKFYTLITASDFNQGEGIRGDSVYLLDYDLDTNNCKSTKIDIDDGFYVSNSKFTKGKLELLLGSMKKGYTLNLINYDLNNYKEINQFKKKIESDTKDYFTRKEGNTLITDDKIYITLSNYSNNYWDNDNKIYVVQRYNEEIVYEGKLKFSTDINSLVFKEE